MTPDELEQQIRAVGAERYHDKHPFHRLLHSGKLNKGQVQAWALNRYCYQAAVPRKDAALMSRTTDRELRREWIHRILDHDGSGDEEGGIERWLVLTDGLGLDREYVTSMAGALPATRFAVEAYVAFVRERSLVEAVASSLTELFAPSIHRERIAGMLKNYDFIDESVMAYFRRRLNQATRDAVSRSTTSNGTPPRASCRSFASRRSGSSAMCCGRSWTHCIMLTSRLASSHPVLSSHSQLCEAAALANTLAMG